ncbi:hypothetical protein NQZ68_026892 [Dissostichus eleginoides]|nr:hypothetical protein NQZ68_026892 [Dissostichus eleginoides]
MTQSSREKQNKTEWRKTRAHAWESTSILVQTGRWKRISLRVIHPLDVKTICVSEQVGCYCYRRTSSVHFNQRGPFITFYYPSESASLKELEYRGTGSAD